MAMRAGGILCILVLATICIVLGSSIAAGSSAVAQSRSKRSLLDFGTMISCVLPNVGDALSAALRYNNYGCWCGVGGGGPTVDSIDQCCKVHDACYGSVETQGCGDPKYEDYHWRYSGGRVFCEATLWQRLFGGGNNECQKAICECDRTAVVCFEAHNHIYNSNNINYDDRSHCAK